MRNLTMLTLLLAAVACSSKGDPDKVPEYIEALGATELEQRALAVENLVRVGEPALDALSKARHPLAKQIHDYLKAPRSRALIEFIAVVDDQTLKRQINKKRLEKERYGTPAGHLWIPVHRDTWKEFGGQRETLVAIGKRRWTEKTLEKIGTDQQNLEPVVTFSVLPPLLGQFGAFTGGNKGRRMAIVLLGEVVSAPRIQSRIEGHGLVTGLSADQQALLLGVYRATR